MNNLTRSVTVAAVAGLSALAVIGTVGITYIYTRGSSSKDNDVTTTTNNKNQSTEEEISNNEDLDFGDYPAKYLPYRLTVNNPYLPEMLETVRKLTARGKGILAIDEFPFAVDKKFNPIKLENNEENRRRYRQLFITANNVEQYITGMILYDATLYQKTNDGTKFVDILNKKGIVPGIKVDEFFREMAAIPGSNYTQGITDLDKRCKQYYKDGARFAKWRAVLYIQNGYVDMAAIQESAITLAKYAAICQVNGLVPIVEPELMMTGDHSLEMNQYWTEKILAELYQCMSDYDVILEASLLKPNMCIAGKTNKNNGNIKDSANATVTALKRTVPPAVVGIMFLSGGQGAKEAFGRLSLMNNGNNGSNRFPWTVSFSFARVLQGECLKVWNGKDENSEKAQNAFIESCKACSLAALGK